MMMMMMILLSSAYDFFRVSLSLLLLFPFSLLSFSTCLAYSGSCWSLVPFPLFLRSFLSFCRLFHSPPPLFPPASRRYSRLSLPLSPPPPPPPATLRVLRSHSLARPALSALFPPSLAPVRPTLSLYLLLSSSPSASRAHTYVHWPCLCLSPSIPCPYDEECRQRSNRSLAFARAASLLHPSAVREPAPPPLPLPSVPPSAPLLTLSLATSSSTSFPSPPPPPPSLLFPQISSTIFAISITRAHLFLL